MRLALVSDWCLPRLGGIELQLRDLALQLRERGHDVEIITPVEGPPELEGIPVHRLGAPRLPGAGIVFTAGAFRRIRELYAAGKYDVVHVHFGIVAPAAYGATFIAQQMGLPTVATFHSVLTHFDLPLGLVRGMMGVADWRVKWSAVSSVVAAAMRPLVGNAPVTVIPNGIDVQFWSTRSSAVPRPPVPGPPTAVAVLRLHRRKRPAALIRAIAQAGLPVHLDVIGDGPQRAELARRVAALGLGDTVTMHGWQPREAVRAALHRADVFLLPSRLEAFGIAALEARAAGVPVIAMSGSGAADFLVHDRDALLADDDAQFARYLGEVAARGDRFSRLAAGCASPPRGVGWHDVIDEVEREYAAAVGA